MQVQAINTSPVMGHNNPPSDVEILRAALAERQAPVLSNAQKLLKSAERAPTECKDEETAKNITTMLKLIASSAKSVESAREAEKAPFLEGGRTVDNFFYEFRDKLKDARAKVNKPLDDYLKAKEAAERKRLAEIAEAERIAAKKQMEDAMKMDAEGKSEFADSAIAQAAITENAANKAQAQSMAKPAALASTRSSSATAGLRTRWVGVDINRDIIDLEKLRQHIPAAALQTALNSFIAAGGREIKGAVIKEQTDTYVR